MEDSGKEIIVQPNVIQIYPGFIPALFWDYFCYIDKPSYTIDGILNMYEIPVTFMKSEFRKPDGDYVFCFLKCRKKYTNDLLEKVFPRLHSSNTVLDGNNYLKECEKVMNILCDHFANNQERTA